MTEKVVEDKSKDFEVWGVSVSYTDGPMALSLGHMWKSSIFTVEDTTSHKDVKGGGNECTGFVTGITLNF